MSGLLLRAKGTDGVLFTRPPPIVGIGGGGPAVSGTDFPGMPGGPSPNLVGHANTPANVGGSGNPAWPGAFQNGSATFMGGIYAGLSNPCAIGDGTGGTLHLVDGGTYYFLDINPGVYEAANVPNSTGRVGDPPVHNVTFIGCRFTAAGATTPSIACVNHYQTGSSPLFFKYCTIAPIATTLGLGIGTPHPIPAPAWPSSSVGQGFVINDTTYQTPWESACRDGINISVGTGGLVRLEHCDVWGTSAFVGMSGAGFVRGARSGSVNGTTQIVDCWLHDNMIPTPLPWTSTANYPVNSYSAGTDFNVYKATVASGPANGGAQGPPDTNPGGKWIFWSTYQHSNGVMPTNVLGMSNVLVDHCTISGLGNTVACNAGHNWTIGTFWNPATAYTTGQEALSVDGYHYVAARPNTGVDPAGDIHPLDWTQDGFNHDDNVVFRRNFLSGAWFSATVDLGYGNSNSTGIVFEDNILSNAVMWNRLVYASNPITDGGPYTPDQSGIFNGASGNSWRRNVYSVWPGSAAWDATRVGMDGWFVWPDNSINNGVDWHN